MESHGSLDSTEEELPMSVVISGDLYPCLGAKMENF